MIEIKSKKIGAELISINFNGEEKLHDGISFWNRHSPVLFPIVGKLKNGETIIENQVCRMGQHGFARDMEFEEVGEDSYLLRYNENTLEKFPYKFELYICYETTDDSVTTKYKIKNIDDRNIMFGLGAHPAFRCNYENCELEFDKDESELKIYQLEDGLVKDVPEDKSSFIDENKIKLHKNIFDNDAIILKDLSSKVVTLKENNEKILEFDFNDFPYLGIWSKPGANFLCIEPWFNTADKVSSDGKFENKEDLINLSPKGVFECKYTVKFF